MSKRIIIDPVTRIEGHAKISIYLDDEGNVSDAEFHVVEFRGFEKFCEGRPFSEMPGITQRICGICPVSHTLASAKADGMGLGLPISATIIGAHGGRIWADSGPAGATFYFTVPVSGEE